MKKRRLQNARVITWCLCIASLLVTIHFMTVFEGSIGAARAAARELNARIASNEAIIARSSRLRKQEQEAWNDLSALSIGSSDAESFSRFMRNMVNLAAKLHVRIVSTNVSAETPDVKPSDRRLLPRKVMLLVRGRFAEIVHFVQELTRQRPVAELGIPRVTADPQAASKGLVVSTIQLTLYRLVLEATGLPHG